MKKQEVTQENAASLLTPQAVIKNAKGQLFYGMHFYPGVAEYQEPGKEPQRIFLNEDTIRSMGPSFAGRPIFVEHVDDADESLDELKDRVDGWVVRSFYNQLDGKHWAEFMITSERGIRAIQKGMRLSNAYIPKTFSGGGLWNGVSYSKEVTSGEYDHLALVSNPRYEESVVMTPEEFKKYNEGKEIELKMLKNSKENKKEISKMKFSWFKKEKVENAADFETMSVVLPKSGKEITLAKLVEDHDLVMNMHGYANGDHMVKLNEKEEMSVNDLVKKYNDMLDESAKSKSKEENPKKEEAERKADDEMSGEDDKEEQDIDYSKKQNAADEAARKKQNFEKVKNAPQNVTANGAKLELPSDMLARGKALFGK